MRLSLEDCKDLLNFLGLEVEIVRGDVEEFNPYYDTMFKHIGWTPFMPYNEYKQELIETEEILLRGLGFKPIPYNYFEIMVLLHEVGHYFTLNKDSVPETWDRIDYASYRMMEREQLADLWAIHFFDIHRKKIENWVKQHS